MEIKVQFFDKFNISYNGVPLVGDKVHKESQFNRLLLALLHAWPNGVEKDKLEKFVIGEAEFEEEHSALRVIVYKAKKKLEKLGLQEENIIYQEKGIYYWTKDIPVVSDCNMMEKYYEEAESIAEDMSTEALEKRKLLYLNAAYLYKGEFLDFYAAETSIAIIAKHYRELFVNCIGKATAILTELKDWDNLEMLGRFAVSVQSYCDWEVLVMEALVEKRLFDEATEYYSDVVDSYLKDCGIYPSTNLMNIMDQLGSSMERSVDTLDNIQASLNEESIDRSGGYSCSFPVFKGIYQMALRQMERTGQTAYLLLCSIEDNEGNEISNEVRMEELSKRLSDAIRTSIRHGDMYTRYGISQYLILLANTSRENCEIVQNRINSTLYDLADVKIKYHINSVFCDF